MSKRGKPTFTCEHCGKSHIWERGLAGLAVRCACGQTMRVPAARPKESEGEIDLLKEDPAKGASGGPANWQRGDAPGEIGASAGRRDRGAEPFELADPGRSAEKPPARERLREGGPSKVRKPAAKVEGEDSEEVEAFELADEREPTAEPGVKCPSCGTDIPGGQRVCGRCGLNLITGEHVGRKKRRRSKIAEQAAVESGGSGAEATPAPDAEAEAEPAEGEEDEEPRVIHEISRLDVLKLREIPIGVLIGGSFLLVILSWMQAAGDGGGGFIAQAWENLSGVVIGAGVLAIACLLMGFVADVDFGPIGTAMLKIASAFVGGAALGTLAALPLGEWGLVLGFPVMILATGGLLMWMFEIGPWSVVIAFAVSALLGLLLSGVVDDVLRVVFPFF